MRKELLLSLIAAGVVPTAALANIDATSEVKDVNDAEKWVNNGLGSVYRTGDLLDGKAYTGIFYVDGASASNLTCAIDGSLLPAGNYEFKATGENIKLSVLKDGKEDVYDEKAKAYVLDGKSAYVVKVESASVGSWELKSLKIELVCDFVAAKKALDKLTASEEDKTNIYTALVGVTATDQGVGHLYATNIKTRAYDYDELGKEIKGIQTEIAKLTKANEDGDFATAVKIYKDLGLGTDPVGYTATVEAAIAKIVKFNKVAEEQNKLSANYKANQDKKAELDARATGAKAIVDGTTYEEDADELVKSNIDAAKAAFNKKYEVYDLSAFDVDDVTLATSTEVDEDGEIIPNAYDNAETATAELETLAGKVKTAKVDTEANVKAYNEIQDLLKSIDAKYKEYLSVFMGYTGEYGATQVGALAKIKNDVADAEEGTLGKLKKTDDLSGVTYKTIAQECLDAMDALYAKVTKHVADSDKAYEAQDADLKKAVADLAKVKEDLDKLPSSEMWNGREALDEDYDEIDALLKEARTMIDDNKLEYACEDEPLNLAAVNKLIGDLKDKITAANDGIVGTWSKNNTDLEALLTRLKKANEKLDEIGTETGYNITDRFDEAYNAVKKDINEVIEINNENLLKHGTKGYTDQAVNVAYVETGVENYETLAQKTATAFGTKYKAYADLTAKLAVLENQVKYSKILSGNQLSTKDYRAQWNTYKKLIEDIKTGMDAAAELTADALYQAVDKVDVEPVVENAAKDKEKLPVALESDINTFAQLLTTGNMQALVALAKEYNADFDGAAAKDIYGTKGVDLLKEKMAGTATVDGYDKKVDALDTKVKAVKDDATTTDVNEATPGYQALDKDIVDLYYDMKADVTGLMAECKANVKAYDEFKNSDLVKLYADDLETWIKDNSYDPARGEKAKETGWFGDSDYKQIVKDMKSINTTVKAAYDANKCTSDVKLAERNKLYADIINFQKKVEANETNHDLQLKYAEDAIAEVLQAIKVAGACHYSETVTFKFEVGGKQVEMTLAQVQQALKDIQNKDLKDVNQQVYTEYADHKSGKDDLYGKVRSDVKDYIDGITTDYAKAVTRKNLEVMETALGNVKDDLDKAYKAYVAKYNRYVVKDADFPEYNTYVDLLKEAIEAEYGHAQIQYYYELMRTLKEKAEAIAKDASPAIDEETGSVKRAVDENGKELVDEKGNPIFADGILDVSAFDEVKKEITDCQTEVEKLDKDLNKAVVGNAAADLEGFAGTYMTAQFDAAQLVIEDAEEIMGNALMTIEEIYAATDEADKHIQLAYLYMTSGKVEVEVDEDADPAMPTVGASDINSGDIEKYFTNIKLALAELALVEIDTYDVVKKHWDDVYADTNEKLEAAVTKFNDKAALALAGDAKVVAAQGDLDEAVAEIERIGEDADNWYQGSPVRKFASAIGKGIMDENDKVVEVGLKSQLAAYLAQAEAAADVAEARAKANEANMDALAAYKLDAKNLKADLDEMHEIIGGLGLSKTQFEKIRTGAADEAYYEFEKALVDKDGNDITNANDDAVNIDPKKDAVTPAINDAYADAYDVEKAYLDGVLAEIEAEFNTQYQASKAEDKAKFDEIDELITAQRDALNNLPTYVELDDNGKPVIGADGKEIEHLLKDKITVQTLKNIEDALFAIEIGDFKATQNPDATVDAVKALDEVAAGVEEKLDELKEAIADYEATLNDETLAGWMHTPTGVDAEALADELAKIKTAYGKDNSVETSMGYYKKQLGGLETAIAAAATTIESLQAVADTELSKRNDSNAWADAMDAELAAAETYLNNILANMAEYKKINPANYDALVKGLNGEVYTYDDDGEITGIDSDKSGLLTVAKYCVQKAREEYSLPDSNTWWNEKWEAVYDEDGNAIWVLVDSQVSVHTSLYNLTNINNSLDYLAYVVATDEAQGWLDAAATEYNKDYNYINGGERFLNLSDLRSELSDLFDDYWTLYNEFNYYFTNVENRPVQIKNGQGLVKKLQDLYDKAKANHYKLGDLNDDGNVTTADFVQLVDIILKKQGVEIPEVGTVGFARADVNADGIIGVGDAVKEMRIVNGVAGAAAPMRTANECSASFAQGVLNVENNFTVASVMVDLKGVSADEVALGSRAAGMQMVTNTLEDGTLRVVIIATDGTTISGNEGAVLGVNGNATVAQAVVADVYGNEYTVVSGETTAIETITNALKNAGEKIYDMSGKLMNGLKKGVNIIRNADGTSSKVLK